MIKLFLTRYTLKNKLRNGTLIIYHTDRKCIYLNSPYQNANQKIPNSGIEGLQFKDIQEMHTFFRIRGAENRYKICDHCKQILIDQDVLDALYEYESKQIDAAEIYEAYKKIEIEILQDLKEEETRIQNESFDMLEEINRVQAELNEQYINEETRIQNESFDMLEEERKVRVERKDNSM